jgi:hypothetical protein
MRELTGNELDAVCGGAFSWTSFYSKLKQTNTNASNIEQGGGFLVSNTANVTQVSIALGSIEVL